MKNRSATVIPAKKNARSKVRTSEQKARLSIRLAQEQKRLIERAATYYGLNTTDFTIATLVERAREVVQDHELIELSDRDRDRFIHILDNPPEPNEALRKANQRYRKLIISSES